MCYWKVKGKSNLAISQESDKSFFKSDQLIIYILFHYTNKIPTAQEDKDFSLQLKILLQISARLQLHLFHPEKNFLLQISATIHYKKYMIC
jgi:hypothetical protein